ncbi:hypothetical protein M9Y10_026222 [Tritrichomonas musculus]|uniref:Alcohol dehydrogenase, iron-containing family protein n=1 Tax=Tritrichomonas musculus TaxID=1915356 RepID=A0ABR2H700_9EUKA
MQWLWQNTTQVGFGVHAVKDHLNKFIEPKSKVLCTFGGGSIDKNGVRNDVNAALKELQCEVRWEGGIPPNPEYKRLMEICQVIREFQPAILLAVGGGSIIDGTKFLCAAAKLPEDQDPWETIMVKHEAPAGAYKLGVILTIPATGSEWNNGFVISRREKGLKMGNSLSCTYPLFSLIDPQYTMTLPVRQLRNGVFDAFTHCVDQFLFPPVCSMFDNFWMSTMKELVEIGPNVIKQNSSLELHERLCVACSFALNMIFTLEKPPQWEIHQIGHQLTAFYEIDHGSSLAMVMPHFLESQFEVRKELYAKAAEFVFDVRDGNVEQKGHAFIQHVREFIKQLGMAETVSKWEGVKINNGDIDKVTHEVMVQSSGSEDKPFGLNGCVTKQLVHSILEKVIV